MFTQSIAQNFQQPSIVPDNPGTRVSYRRWNGQRNVVLTGVIVGVVTSIPPRCAEVVFDYVVMPTDARYCHLSGMVVNEGDIEWSGTCPRCNGEKIIGIIGDQSIDCPDCSDIGEVLF